MVQHTMSLIIIFILSLFTNQTLYYSVYTCTYIYNYTLLSDDFCQFHFFILSINTSTCADGWVVGDTKQREGIEGGRRKEMKGKEGERREEGRIKRRKEGQNGVQREMYIRTYTPETERGCWQNGEGDECSSKRKFLLFQPHLPWGKKPNNYVYTYIIISVYMNNHLYRAPQCT